MCTLQHERHSMNRPIRQQLTDRHEPRKPCDMSYNSALKWGVMKMSNCERKSIRTINDSMVSSDGGINWLGFFRTWHFMTFVMELMTLVSVISGLCTHLVDETQQYYRHYSNHASIHSLHVQSNDFIDRLSILCIFFHTIYASIYAISWPDVNIYVFRSQHTYGNQHHLCSYWSHIKCSKQSFDYYTCRVSTEFTPVCSTCQLFGLISLPLCHLWRQHADSWSVLYDSILRQ